MSTVMCQDDAQRRRTAFRDLQLNERWSLDAFLMEHFGRCFEITALSVPARFLLLRSLNPRTQQRQQPGDWSSFFDGDMNLRRCAR